MGLSVSLPVSQQSSLAVSWMQGPEGALGSQALQKQGNPRDGPELGAMKMKVSVEPPHLPRLHLLP